MAKENAQNLIETSDYIGHHLVNLTFGWCEKTSSWGFANHQQELFRGLDSACKVSEMGFWSFHLDTIFMSILLGAVVFGFFGLVNRQQKRACPVSYKILLNLFMSLLQAQSTRVTTAPLK